MFVQLFHERFFLEISEPVDVRPTIKYGKTYTYDPYANWYALNLQYDRYRKSKEKLQKPRYNSYHQVDRPKIRTGRAHYYNVKKYNQYNPSKHFDRPYVSKGI